MSELEAQIKVVAEVRKEASDAVAVKVAIQAEYEADNKDMFEFVATVLQEVKVAENILHELTLKAYAETGNKHPATGVGIREVTKLAYDTTEALSWATEHKMALKLNETAFEKIVKASPLDFVTISQEPLATIATQLED